MQKSYLVGPDDLFLNESVCGWSPSLNFFSTPCSPSCVEKIDHDLIQRECMGRSISQKSRTNENISNRGWTLGIKPYSMIEVRSRKESWMIREIFYWPSEEFPVLNLKVQKCRFGLSNLMKNIYKQKGFVCFFAMKFIISSTFP